jgi:hypothetical protein
MLSFYKVKILFIIELNGLINYHFQIRSIILRNQMSTFFFLENKILKKSLDGIKYVTKYYLLGL